MKRARAVVDELHDPKKAAALRRVLARVRKQERPRAAVFREPGSGFDAGASVPLGVGPERWARLLEWDARSREDAIARRAFRTRFGRDVASVAGDVPDRALDRSEGLEQLLGLLLEHGRKVLDDVVGRIGRDLADRLLGKLVRHGESPVPPVGSGAANAVACSSRRSKSSRESTRRHPRKGRS